MTQNNIKCFKFFSNYMDIALELPPEKRDRFLGAICMYVMCDEEPDFGDEYDLRIAFKGVKMSLDKSKQMSKNRQGKSTDECGCEDEEPIVIRTSNEEKATEKSNENQNEIKTISRNISSFLVSSFNVSNKPLGKGGVGEKPFRKSDYTLLSDQLMAYWNEAFADTQVPKVLRMTTKRQVGIRQRLDDHYTQKQLFEAIDKARASDFCTSGQWGFGFDWIFCYKGNIQKVLEGNYDNKNQATNVDKLLGAARADPKMGIWFGNDPPKKNALDVGMGGDST